MKHTSPEQSLLIAEFSPQDYANAFIFLWRVVTAGHVAQGVDTITVPGQAETGVFTFEFAPHARDVARSREKIPTIGIERAVVPNIGENLVVYGHHGPQRTPFQIPVKVVEILLDRRIRVESTDHQYFQKGMSGSPALTAEGAVVGILSKGVSGTHGKQILLEPIIIASGA